MDNTLVFGLVGVILLALGAVLLYARATNKDIGKLVPPEIVDRILDQGDRLLDQGLAMAATTESPLDDQFFITALELRGWKVTGSPGSGYTVTPPVKV